MNEFEGGLSMEDLSSLLVSNSQLVTIPISTPGVLKANSNSNVIDLKEDHGGGGIQDGLVIHKKRFHSMDDIFDASVRKQRVDKLFKKVMSDRVPSSPESDSSYASSPQGSPSSSGSSPTCEISLLERLIRTHPVWFLPSLQRGGALHLLQGRDVGSFIVRASTQPKTMALSVTLPGNYVEHYLLKANDGQKISLENSDHTFGTVHELVAFYTENSDEIPVCLKIPAPIAEATSRQQLSSVALLGQEFWTLSGSNNNNVKDSVAEEENRSRYFPGSGLRNYSGSTHSLIDTSQRPSRPTTLDIGTFRNNNGVGNACGTPNPPPVPVRWSRSALLTPLSQPSSVQSTPSEVPSTFSEKSGRQGKRRKNKSESIHYKDTEILALGIFKGSKSVFEDRASDYEDIWSPQYRSNAPKLSTFKPDVIPISHHSESGNSPHAWQDKETHNLSNNSMSPAEKVSRQDLTLLNVNVQNNRRNQSDQVTDFDKTDDNSKLRKSQNGVNDEVFLKEEPIDLYYSEPVDSICSSKSLQQSNNIRWSQPSLPSLQLDVNGRDYVRKDSGTGSGQGKSGESLYGTQMRDSSTARNKNLCIGQQAISNSSSSHTDVSSIVKSCTTTTVTVQVNNSLKEKSGRKTHTVTCASVDNLCHFPFKRTKSKVLMKNGNDGNIEISQPQRLELKALSLSPTPTPSSGESHVTGNEFGVKSPENTSKSWSVDDSWELVMWQKEEEKRNRLKSAKFPIFPSPIHSPKSLRKTPPSESSHTENSMGSMSNASGNEEYRSLQRRFSCYDNLERSKAETNAEEETDSDEDKISPPWDSTKWEHLMKVISESTQQLDLLNSVGHGTNNNGISVSLPETEGSKSQGKNPFLSNKNAIRISSVLEFDSTLGKAGKSVADVVHRLAVKDDGVFGPTLRSFISCTIAAKILDPYKVMRNVRQFISGMKNYLVGVNSESDVLRKEIKKQTETLSDSEFLNIDHILEDVLIDLVVAPLNLHIRGLIEAYSVKNGEPLQVPNDEADLPHLRNANVSKATLAKLKNIYSGFEDTISPMKKLDKWNEFVCQVQEMDNYSTDSFLPLLGESLGSVCTSKLPCHVDYMIGLLPPSLREQNNYSLSLLQSAVSMLKEKPGARKGSTSLTSVRVLIPDERNGTLLKKMVPVRSSTTNKEVAKIIASKLGVTTPSDYVLVTVKNGEETVCPESELVYNCLEDGGGAALAYKRIDAKIGWPRKIS